MCLQDSSCNHDVSKMASDCAGPAGKTHFCAEETPWGDIWDKTKYGFCKIGKYDNDWNFDIKGSTSAWKSSWCLQKEAMGQTCYESEKYEQLSISDCKNIDSNAVAFTIKKQKDWDHNQHKEISIDVISCGYNGSMATTKSDCLDSCTRSDGLG